MTSIIKNKKKLNNINCLISHESLEKKIEDKTGFVIRLNCGHCFCYRAFIKAFIIDNKNIESYNRCPYCLSKIKHIPILINKYLKK